MTKRSSEVANGSFRGSYRVREFADLAGVTVKALLHYERLGLLAPTRSPSGHRLYSARDLHRLRLVIALKHVGIALVNMRGLIDADSATLQMRLVAHRDVLAREREHLVQAERAVALVEEGLRHAPSDGSGLSRLVDVIEMPREAVQMKRYFSADVWERARSVYERWPDEHLIDLFREIAAAIPEGPATEHAANLLQRWKTLEDSLWRDLASDPDVARKLRDGFGRAWMDRNNWPDVFKRRFADYHMNEVSAFLGRVSIVVRTRLGSSWSAGQQGRPSPRVA
jgi:DNA-binding transcriptional MerR regulator